MKIYNIFKTVLKVERVYFVRLKLQEQSFGTFKKDIFWKNKIFSSRASYHSNKDSVKSFAFYENVYNAKNAF